MPENGNNSEFAERLYYTESVRLLWEGTRKATLRGIDTQDLASLCDVIARLADRRLKILEAEPGALSLESQEAARQLQECRDQARGWLEKTKRPMPEPDWQAIAERTASTESTPMEFPS